MDFSQIALLMVVAAVSGIIAKVVKQPLIIGYLFAGIFLAYFGKLGDTESFHSLGKIGVSLLLFSVGVEMNLKDILTLGKTSIIAAISQIVFTSIIGFGIVSLLGFTLIPAMFIAFSLTFSSTIVVVKMLSEKGDLQSLYGKITLGFLLVQDFVAMIALIALSGFASGGESTLSLLMVVIKSLVLVLVLWFLSKGFLKKLFESFVDSNGELIFILSVAWALGLAALVGGPLGLSIEIGGLLAGLSLASLPENLQISSKTRSIRDFFLTLFFISLGSDLIVADFISIIFPALVLSLFVLIGNPLIQLIILGRLGFSKKTIFTSSIAIAQVSEFSLILMTFASGLGLVNEREVALVVFVTVITMVFSTYLTLKSEYLFRKLKKFIAIFEAKNRKNLSLEKLNLFDHVILIGADRTGRVIIPRLAKTYPFIVVDFNPSVVNELNSKGIPAIFGDITEEELQAVLNLDHAKLVISTTADFIDNSLLLESIKKLKQKPKIILKAKNHKEALKLYKKGATYVIIPEVLSGEHIRHLIKNYGHSSKLDDVGKSHKNRLSKL